MKIRTWPGKLFLEIKETEELVNGQRYKVSILDYKPWAVPFFKKAMPISAIGLALLWVFAPYVGIPLTILSVGLAFHIALSLDSELDHQSKEVTQLP